MIVPRSIIPACWLLLAAAAVPLTVPGVADAAPPLPPLPSGPAPAPKPTPVPSPAPTESGGGGIGENVVEAEIPAPTIMTAAVAAATQYCTDIVAGHYKIMTDRMYLPDKERMAKRAGGTVADIDAKMQKTMEKFQTSGVTILSTKPQGAPQIFEVTLGKKAGVGGSKVETMVYTKWLVLIPTVGRLQVVDKGEKHVLERTSFLVAISEKGKNDWTFMDGSSTSLADLRSLFPTLPDMKLPELGGKEITPGQ